MALCERSRAVFADTPASVPWMCGGRGLSMEPRPAPHTPRATGADGVLGLCHICSICVSFRINFQIS